MRKHDTIPQAFYQQGTGISGGIELKLLDRSIIRPADYGGTSDSPEYKLKEKPAQFCHCMGVGRFKNEHNLIIRLKGPPPIGPYFCGR
jgi:hypothetical protein